MLFRVLSFFFVLPTLAFSAPSANNPITAVKLRVEGATETRFEGIVFTRGHNVTTPSGGTHECDGTNNHINPNPGPTCTSALDTASKLDGFEFDGTFDTNFDDFFITSIAGEAQTSTQFWGLLLNFQFTPVGGCQQEVQALDEVLWAFDAFNKAHFLKLSGPNTAHRNKPVTFTVTDGSSGVTVAGAEVDNQQTNAAGQVTLTFSSLGVQHLKADKSDSIRSNNLDVLVLP